MNCFKNKKEQQKSGLIFATVGTFDIQYLWKLKRNKAEGETCFDYIKHLADCTFTRKARHILTNHQVNNQAIIANFADDASDLFNVTYIEKYIIKKKRSYLMKNINLSTFFCEEYINSISKKYKQLFVTLSDPYKNKVYINDRYIYFCVNLLTKSRFINHKVLHKDKLQLHNVIIIDLCNGGCHKKEQRRNEETKGKIDITNSVALDKINYDNTHESFTNEYADRIFQMEKSVRKEMSREYATYQNTNKKDRNNKVATPTAAKKIEKEKVISSNSKLKALYENIFTDAHFESADFLAVFEEEGDNFKDVLQNIFKNNNSKNAKVHSLTLRINESFYDKEDMIDFKDPNSFLFGDFNLNEMTLPAPIDMNSLLRNSQHNNSNYSDFTKAPNNPLQDMSHVAQNSLFPEISPPNYCNNVFLNDPLQVGYANNLFDNTVNEQSVNQIYSSIFSVNQENPFDAHSAFSPEQGQNKQSNSEKNKKDLDEKSYDSFGKEINESNPIPISMFQSNAFRRSMSGKKGKIVYELNLENIEKDIFCRKTKTERKKKRQHVFNYKREANNSPNECADNVNVDIYDMNRNTNRHVRVKEKRFFINRDASDSSACSSISVSFLKGENKEMNTHIFTSRNNNSYATDVSESSFSGEKNYKCTGNKKTDIIEHNKNYISKIKNNNDKYICDIKTIETNKTHVREKQMAGCVQHNTTAPKQEHIHMYSTTAADTDSSVDRKLEEHKMEMLNFRNTQLQKVSEWIFNEKIMGHMISERYTYENLKYVWDNYLKENEKNSVILQRKKKMHQFANFLMEYIGRIHFDIEVESEGYSSFLISKKKNLNEVQKISFNNGLIHISTIYDMFNFLIEALITKSELHINKNKLYYVLSIFSPDFNFIYYDKYVQNQIDQNGIHFFFFYCNEKVYITLLNTEYVDTHI